MPRSRRSPYVLTGVVAGAFSGLAGVGGGSLMVPLMTGQLRLTQHRAHGTSLAIIAFVAACSLAALLLSVVANGLDASVLKRISGVVALGLGMEMIYSSWRRTSAEATAEA